MSPGETENRSRLPLARPFALEAQRLLIRIAAALCLTSGTGGMLVGGLVGDDLRHAKGHIIASAVAQAMGLGFLMASFSWERLMRWFPAVVYLGLPGSVALVAIAEYTAGPRFVTASIVYVELTALAFYLLPRRYAFGFIGVVGVAHGWVLAADGDYTTPLAQWLYLMGVLVAVGLTFGRLLTQGVDESAQLNRLRRFLAPQVADALLTSGDDDILEPHRRQIAVIFCDLRGFTRFAANHEPEDVVQVLDEYYDAAGERLREATATVGAFAGDGLMAYFNDPVPCDDPAGRALQVARRIQDDLEELAAQWARRGFSLGHGIGVAYGYATLGVVGFEGRSDYTALGPVVNLASRLSDAAEHGEILRRCARVRSGGGDLRRRGTQARTRRSRRARARVCGAFGRVRLGGCAQEVVDASRQPLLVKSARHPHIKDTGFAPLNLARNPPEAVRRQISWRQTPPPPDRSQPSGGGRSRTRAAHGKQTRSCASCTWRTRGAVGIAGPGARSAKKPATIATSAGSASGSSSHGGGPPSIVTV